MKVGSSSSSSSLNTELLLTWILHCDIGVNALFRIAMAMLRIAKPAILAASESTDVIAAMQEQQYATQPLLDVRFLLPFSCSFWFHL
jgi:hypothetical protein